MQHTKAAHYVRWFIYWWPQRQGRRIQENYYIHDLKKLRSLSRDKCIALKMFAFLLCVKPGQLLGTEHFKAILFTTVGGSLWGGLYTATCTTHNTETIRVCNKEDTLSFTSLAHWPNRKRKKEAHRQPAGFVAAVCVSGFVRDLQHCSVSLQKPLFALTPNWNKSGVMS